MAETIPQQADEIQLTARELAVAREAAKIAIKGVSDEFYKQVGKGVITKLLVWLGIAFVGFALAKGWFVFPGPK